MILYSEISIPLTPLKLDVYIGGIKEEYVIINKKRYGYDDKDANDIFPNECSTAYTEKGKGELDGTIQFCLILSQLPKDDIPVFLHEMWHLMWQISKVVTDFRFNSLNNSRWAANLIEELARLIINAEYKEINPLE